MKARTVISLLMGVVGVALMAYVDWRLAVGAYLIVFANNIAYDTGGTITLTDNRKEPPT